MSDASQLLELVHAYAGANGVERVNAALALAASLPDETLDSADSHPMGQAIAAATILARLETRLECVAAALLVTWGQDACPAALIQKSVGPEVSRLVEGVRQIREGAYLRSLGKKNLSDRKRSELYHAFVETLEDPQFILIELAHQLNKLRQHERLDPAAQKRLAFETQQAYAPLAHRLGIWRLKWEMEEAAFRISNPVEFGEIANAVYEHSAGHEAIIDRLTRTLESELDAAGIPARVIGRAKHVYSIYRKMQRKGVSLEAIYDIRALRVLVDDIPTCYRTLGVVHNLWTPIPTEFDDYIANSKRNGYQSLHTAVVDSEGNTLEVQIRTHQMHAAAELGIAAHWRYKETRGSNQVGRKKREIETEQAIDIKISWLRAMLQAPDGNGGTQSGSHLDDPADRTGYIFVFTPLGDMIRLPAGSTPIDFAYRIHTELGHRCYGAKVNDRIVPLNYHLITGDVVEVITKKRGGPNLNWLSVDQGFIKTRDARKKISNWFRRQKRTDDVARGHEILDRELVRQGVKSIVSYDEVARLLRFDRTEEMLVQIGSGVITTDRIAAAINTRGRPTKEDLAREAEAELVTAADETKTLIESKAAEDALSTVQAGLGMRVGSARGLHVQLGKCCYPVPPERIVGFVTRGHGVTVHLEGCPNMQSVREPERIIEASWGRSDEQLYPVLVIVEALNRRGLMGDIGKTVSKEKVEIGEAKVKKKTHWAVFELLLEVSDADQLQRVLQRLEHTKGVRTVFRKVG